MTTARERRLGYLAWTAVCVIWGTTYLGIRICLESMPPALMGGLRWTIAGTLLTGYLVLRGQPLPPRSRWGSIGLLGFLLLGLGNGGVVFAEQWITSGLAAVLVATSPFWMAGVEATLADGERINRRTAAGLVLGFSGILVLVWPDLALDGTGDRAFLGGIVAIQIAAFGWALGSSYSRRRSRQDHILGTTALQMLAGGAILLRRRHAARRMAGPVLHHADDGVTRAICPRWARSAVSSRTRTPCGTCRCRSSRSTRTSTRSSRSPSVSCSWASRSMPGWRRPPGSSSRVSAVVRWKSGQTFRPLNSRTRKSTMAMTSRT